MELGHDPSLVKDRPDLAVVGDEEIMMRFRAPGPENVGLGVEAHQADLLEHRDDAAVRKQMRAAQDLLSVMLLLVVEREPGKGLGNVDRPCLDDLAVHVHENRRRRVPGGKEVQAVLGERLVIRSDRAAAFGGRPITPEIRKVHQLLH